MDHARIIITCLRGPHWVLPYSCLEDLFRSMVHPNLATPLQVHRKFLLLLNPQWAKLNPLSEAFLNIISFLWCYKVWEAERLIQVSLPATFGGAFCCPHLCYMRTPGAACSLGFTWRWQPHPSCIWFPRSVWNLYCLPSFPTFKFSSVGSWPCLRMGVECR